MVFALVDRVVSDNIKARMVARRIAAERPQDFPTGKLEMSSENLMGRDPNEQQLYEFAGPNLWLIFHLAGVMDGTSP